MADQYERWVRDGQYVEARYGTGPGVHARGRVVAFCDAPTVTIETNDGSKVHWRADLTHPAEAPDGPAKDPVLHVHHTVWKSLVAYLDSVGVTVHDVSTLSDNTPTFYMDPKVGAWPSE